MKRLIVALALAGMVVLGGYADHFWGRHTAGSVVARVQDGVGDSPVMPE